MPLLLNDTTISSETRFRPLMELADEAFPQTPDQMLSLEQRLALSAGPVADRLLEQHLRRAHADRAFVEKAIASARESRLVPLLHKGCKTISVLALGGTHVVLSTPYLREDRRNRRGKRRRKRHARGSGCYPVLEALGIADRVTPATRSEIALHVVQAASYAEAAALLERRGLACDVASLVRVAEATATESLRLRDAALAAAMQVAVPTNGPLAGKRVRVSTDGGRVRTRVSKRGRKTKAGRHRFTTPWKEPRLLVIDILDEEGTPDRLRLPLYDATIADADTVVALIIGYLRLLGAAHAQVVEFIADGAPWIWQRLTKIREGAEIAQDRFVDVLDFYHASQYLAQTVELCRSLPKPQRVKLYERLRHALRHDADGVETILREMGALATTRRGKVMKRALEFFREPAGRMRYHDLDQRKFPVGSGQVESAVRRVVNLRFKAPGTFWGEARVSHLLHLRASCKAGRWEEVMRGVLSGQFQLPSFEVLDRRAARAHAAAEAAELFDDIVAETLITHDEAEQAAA